MEECEALCTKLAIMSRGQFQCFGSVQHLKSKYGNGYGLILKCHRRRRRLKHDNQIENSNSVNEDDDDDEMITKRVEDFMSYYVPESVLKDKQQNTLFYQIVFQNSDSSSIKTIAQLFNLIENNKQILDLETYSLTQTSLEQVFISFATNSTNANDNNNNRSSGQFTNLAYNKGDIDIEQEMTEEINLG